jgi:glycosyltransferase involved in cell wall biosynthesis
MKVALVVPGGVDRSGVYRVIPALLALIRQLTLHHEVHVFALAQEAMRADWQLAGASIHNIGLHLTRLRAVTAILREHRTASFDIVHSIWSGACGLVAISAAGLLRIPSLVHIAGGELVAVRDINYGGRLSWKGKLREALVLRAATVLTAPSAPIIEAMTALGVAAQRVPLGIDLNEWSARPAVRRDTRERARLIHVASLNRVKDQPTLLRAIAMLASQGLDFHLDIVGQDTLQGEMQALAQSLGVAKYVRFHGFLTQQQLRPLMESAHVMIMSSRHEAGPVAMLEAGVIGVPTVGTAVGHIAEWAPSASVSVPVGNWKALGSATRYLLEHEDQRLQIARAAFLRATSEDAAYTAVRVQDLYRKLTAVE